MSKPFQQSLVRWSASFRRKCCPFKVAEISKSRDSWFFPAPWIDGPEIGPSHWEFCCFRLPIEEPVYVKITTTLVYEYGVENNVGQIDFQIYDEGAGYLFTTFHSEMPNPGLPAKYGFQLFEPITDPEGPCDKFDPAWNSLGQWLGHKIGGAPFIYGSDAEFLQLKLLLQDGYELLLMIREPNYNIADPKLCDDYASDFLFGKDRLNVLLNPTTMDVRYVWG